MNTPSADVRSARAFRLGDFLRDQLRNIAPFITLLSLVVFFSIASPSFASLGNLENILQQVSVTAIIAVGLTFVILTAERHVGHWKPHLRVGARAGGCPGG